MYPLVNPNWLTEAVSEWRQIRQRMIVLPRVPHSSSFQCICGQSHFSTWFRSFLYDIWISIWSHHSVMQRSPCSRKLAAWIAKAIGYYVDKTILKETTDFKRISWTVNRVLLNWIQWKREFWLLSAVSMRSEYEHTPAHSSGPSSPPVSLPTYSFMSGQCCTRNCDRESLC